MKIRWTENSVRLRIAPEELQALQEGRTVIEEFSFPGGQWRLALCPAAATALAGEGGELRFSLSAADCGKLAAPDVEGVYFQQSEPALRYCVEKDFPCAHPRANESGETPGATFAPPPGFVGSRD